jgi:uncharacterized protein
MLKADIDRDLKNAMLARDKRLVSILRSLKSAILYKEVEEGKREEGLDDTVLLGILKKERKSRLDAKEIYQNAGDQKRADEEIYQIGVIEKYLPKEMSEKELANIVNSVIHDLGIDSPEIKDVGKIIVEVRKKIPSADGGLISKIVREIINKG